MDGNSYFKFERGTRARDGIHDGDIKPNKVPLTLGEKFNIAMIVVIYIAAATMSYYWG